MDMRRFKDRISMLRHYNVIECRCMVFHRFETEP